MPVYNCELYIKEAVDSILNQTFTDFEFLIIDDASSDETVNILKSYCDPRFQDDELCSSCKKKIIYEPNNINNNSLL